MSVIQALREKYATTVVIVVCVSLVAFLLMDAFIGPKSFFNKDMDVVSVNGTTYPYKEYMQDIKKAENNYRNQHPDEKMNDEARNRIKEQVYQEFVQKQILQGEYDKLGIAFSPEELRTLTITADADPRIKQIPGFQNPQTGEFDPNRVITFINNVKNAPANNQQALQQKMQWMQMEDMLRNSSKLSKFTSLINNGVYIPKWLSEVKLKEQNEFSNISFVNAPYSTVSDSSVNINNEDLNKYLTKHKEQFQVKANRTIEFVSFDAVASSEDSAKIFDRMDALKAQMDTLDQDEIPGFIGRSSETPFADRYIPESMIQSSVKENILELAPGETYGPYFENNQLIYAKFLGSKNVYDSIEIQQLLVNSQGISDSAAHFKVDSIENLVKNGADFSQMINTATQGQAQNDGKLVITPNNPNIPDDFIQFANENQKGAVGVVQSQYGYHVIKVLNKQDAEKGYKFAYLSTSMEPSQATENAIYSEANKFRGLNETRDKFESSAKKEGLNIQKASNLTAESYQVNNLESSRDIVHWAFNAEKNDVSKVFVLPNSYVIAVLTNITDKGTAPLNDVKPQIEAVVRRHKKGEVISNRIKGDNLQAIASKLGDSISVATGISFGTPFIPNAGFEPKVVGAAFNKNFEKKLSTPVYGENGVYYLRVDSLYNNHADSSAIQQIQGQLGNNLRREISSQLRDVLLKQADIDDRRFSFPGL